VGQDFGADGVAQVAPQSNLSVSRQDGAFEMVDGLIHGGFRGVVD
jgi:hypothetical protein